MKDLSDIEDGFALKRQRENARTHRNRGKRARGKHTIPPPLLKHILSSYTMGNPISRRAIYDYVEIHTREKVLHAEKVKSEHVMGSDHDCWDIHTRKDRYWVITSPTNLYSQYYFPSLDYTLAFHVGVMARIMARQSGAPDDAQRSRLTPVWRRWEQAAETLDTAEEAEDFQAVGMKCRECLIQLVRSLAKPEMVPEGKEAPQRSNFNEWAELIANAVAHGGSAERIRSHMKTIAISVGLDGWLTHANNATRHDAIFVIDATHTVLDAFGRAAIRHESGVPERCPNLQPRRRI